MLIRVNDSQTTCQEIPFTWPAPLALLPRLLLHHRWEAPCHFSPAKMRQEGTLRLCYLLRQSCSPSMTSFGISFKDAKSTEYLCIHVGLASISSASLSDQPCAISLHLIDMSGTLLGEMFLTCSKLRRAVQPILLVLRHHIQVYFQEGHPGNLLSMSTSATHKPCLAFKSSKIHRSIQQGVTSTKPPVNSLKNR